MKQEIRAILQVAKLVGVAMLVGIGVNLAFIFVPLKTIGIICGIFATGFFLKLAYDIALTDIKYKQKLEEMTKK